jgi:hypothetical protein
LIRRGYQAIPLLAHKVFECGRDPLENESESPDHQKNQDRKDGQSHNHRDDERQQYRDSLLKRALKRPRNGDGE